MADCNIKSLPYKYFKHNPKLSEIDLVGNGFHMINVRLFDGLKSLRWVLIKCEYAKYTWFINYTSSAAEISNSLKSLKQCYNNCLNNDVCLLESEVGPEDPLRQEAASGEFFHIIINHISHRLCCKCCIRFPELDDIYF